MIIADNRFQVPVRSRHHLIETTLLANGINASFFFFFPMNYGRRQTLDEENVCTHTARQQRPSCRRTMELSGGTCVGWDAKVQASRQQALQSAAASQH